MKVLRPGHRYELANYNEPDKPGQTLQFIEKEKLPSKDGGPETQFVTINDGTTNEEVLEMLVDRLRALNAKLHSRQTALAITKCEEALMWLENRTVERLARGVEGTPKA